MAMGTGIMLIAFLLSRTGIAWDAPPVEPVRVSTVNTCVYPAHFVDEGEHEIEIVSLEALPPAIRAKLQEYLDARLGRQFAAQLRFKEAGFVDPHDVPEVVQMSRKLGREYEAYVVLFNLQIEEGREYCSGVHLTVDGRTVMDIGLPRVAAAPVKARIVPASTALAIAAEHQLPQPPSKVELAYEPNRDGLIWQVSTVSTRSGSRPQISICNVDAHTGKFIGWTVLDVLINEAPAAAQHAH